MFSGMFVQVKIRQAVLAAAFGFSASQPADLHSKATIEMLAYGVMVPFKPGIEVDVVKYRHRETGRVFSGVRYVQPATGREKQMIFNDLYLPSLGDSAVEAEVAVRLDAFCKKIERDPARVSMEVPVDSEPGDIEAKPIFGAGKSFLLIADTA
ncbi:MAG: hypothetical protein M1820_008018 [Bogoriella megaspora]|nr:MAG: hypothetical protein M1820_008018 [Bogoriella megaspora]